MRSPIEGIEENETMVGDVGANRGERKQEQNRPTGQSEYAGPYRRHAVHTNALHAMTTRNAMKKQDKIQ